MNSYDGSSCTACAAGTACCASGKYSYVEAATTCTSCDSGLYCTETHLRLLALSSRDSERHHRSFDMC